MFSKTISICSDHEYRLVFTVKLLLFLTVFCLACPRYDVKMCTPSDFFKHDYCAFPTSPNQENEDSVPNDLQSVQEQVSRGCGCSQLCFSRMSVTPQYILMHRCNMIEILKPERDMLVMSAVHTGIHVVVNSKRN